MKKKSTFSISKNQINLKFWIFFYVSTPVSSFSFLFLILFRNCLHYPIVLTQHYVHLENTPVLNEKYDIYESEFMKDTTFDWSMSLIFHQLIFLTEFWILFIWQKGNIKNMSSSSEIVWMKREPPPTRIRILTRARK